MHHVDVIGDAVYTLRHFRFGLPPGSLPTSSELTYYPVYEPLGTGYPVVGTGLPGFGCILFSLS